jgi:hypothetical protein
LASPPAFQDLDIELEARPDIFEAFGADAEGHLGVSELVYLGGDAGGMLGGTGNVMGFIWLFYIGVSWFFKMSFCKCCIHFRLEGLKVGGEARNDG